MRQHASILAVVLAALVVLGLVVLGISRRGPDRQADPLGAHGPGPIAGPAPPALAVSPSASGERRHEGYLYGRVTTVDGDAYEGRLRWGGDEEAFWDDFFNGSKATNPWALHVPPEQLTERRTVELFGVPLFDRKRPVDLGRPFMARFGAISRIDADARQIRVTLRSGTVVALDRFSADDLADGLRVWDAGGVVDLEEWRIRSVELSPTPPLGGVPGRLHGTVRTRQGDFTGFVAWDRRAGVLTDTLTGHTVDGELASPGFHAIASIARESPESARVKLVDGREMVLSGTRDVGRGHRGVTVEDPRYGRVLVSWDAFLRFDVELAAAGSTGPGFADFSPGRPLVGTVTTRDGRRLAGRLVFDLDESETTETLDAPSRGIDYTLLFGRVASIVVPADPESAAEVRLHDGAALHLDCAGDLGERNAGLLVLADGRERPDYVPWSAVQRIDLDPPLSRDSR